MASSVNQSGSPVSRKKKSGFLYDIKNTSFGESRSYLFEYGLLLLLTGGLLYVLIAMIQSFYQETQAALPFSFTNNFDIVLLSSFTVLLPLVIILIQRTSESERGDSRVKNLAWRKAFLGVFLAVVSVWAVISSVMFISTVLEYLSNGLLLSADFAWQSSLTHFVTSVFLILTAWTFGNDYRHLDRDHFANLKHFYRYGLIFSAVVIGLLFLFFPFRENRTAYVDLKVSEDLISISTSVNNYYAENGRLPGALTDLSLSSEQTERAGMYNYTFEQLENNEYSLCAEFSTDTKAGNSDAVPDPFRHTVGIDCFSFAAADSPISDSGVTESSTEESILADELQPSGDMANEQL